MPATATKGERTRRRLIEAAASVFADAGYEASYRDLIAASGLSKGAFYFHFPSKPDLAAEVFRVKQTELIEALVAEIASAGSSLDQLAAGIRARARLFDEDRTLDCLPRLASALATEPGMAEEVAAFHRGPADLVASFVHDAQAAGEARRRRRPRCRGHDGLRRLRRHRGAVPARARRAVAGPAAPRRCTRYCSTASAPRIQTNTKGDRHDHHERADPGRARRRPHVPVQQGHGAPRRLPAERWPAGYPDARSAQPAAHHHRASARDSPASGRSCTTRSTVAGR